jgi:N4-gp56 family major capsid protein
MSKTAFATGNALTKKHWEEKLYRDSRKEAYFSRFMGGMDDPEALVHVNRKLTGDKGDKVTFGIVMRLSGQGVISGQTLEGNEESLTPYDYSIWLEQYRHAVRDDGAMSRQRAMFEISEKSKNALSVWGSEKIDSLLFTALQASPTKIIYGGSATSVATLTATDLITPAMISRIKAGARTGWNRTQTPLRPIRINGKKYFVLLVHPDVGYDLTTNSVWTQAHREASLRGMDNPIFSGALGVWNGVIIHEHENINIYTDGGAGSNVNYATCSFMGAQALVWAEGKREEAIQETFDYGNEIGHKWGVMGKAGKPVFNSKDYGSAGFYVARTKIADA